MEEQPSQITESKEGYSPKVFKEVKRYEFHFPNSTKNSKQLNFN